MCVCACLCAYAKILCLHVLVHILRAASVRFQALYIHASVYFQTLGKPVGLCMYKHMCITYIYIYIYICVCVCVCVCVFVFVCVYVFVQGARHYMHVHIHMKTCT